jgi:hypothetical protein
MHGTFSGCIKRIIRDIPLKRGAKIRLCVLLDYVNREIWRRLRWRNIGILVGVIGLIGLVIAWPNLGSKEPSLPEENVSSASAKTAPKDMTSEASSEPDSPSEANDDSNKGEAKSEASDDGQDKSDLPEEDLEGDPEGEGLEKAEESGGPQRGSKRGRAPDGSKKGSTVREKAVKELRLSNRRNGSATRPVNKESVQRGNRGRLKTTNKESRSRYDRSESRKPAKGRKSNKAKQKLPPGCCPCQAPARHQPLRQPKSAFLPRQTTPAVPHFSSSPSSPNSKPVAPGENAEFTFER